MTSNAPETQWWIARDGEQYGPLSDTEMRAFIEMRHLRAADLVWRQGFVDWRPASLIFPMQAHEAPPANLQAMVAAPLVEELEGRFVETEEVPARSHASQPGASAARGGRAAGKLAAKTFSRMTRDAAEAARKGALRQAESGFRLFRGRTIVLAAAVCALVAGGWALVENSAVILRTAGLGFAAVTAGSAAKSGSPEALDVQLQKMPLWAALKKEFPDWYRELLDDTIRASSNNSDSGALSKRLVESLVALRRQHANEALAAGVSRLRGIAEAFVENLKALKARSTDACYAFISQGETSPATIGLIEEPNDGKHLQNQVAAIVAAIAEGRSSPVSREKPSKADYDKLAEGLMRLGWTSEDLKLFANPRALANATPARVCQMVEDWFTAHIAITDETMQERLLVETLRPVVAG